MAANLTQLTSAIVTELQAYMNELEAEGAARAPGYEQELARAIVELVKHADAYRSGASSKINPPFERVCTNTGRYLVDNGWQP